MTLAYKVQPGTRGCDTESVLRMWIKNDLGVDPFVLTGPSLHTVSVTIDRRGPAIHAVVKVRAENGELWYEDEMLERWCIRVMDRLVGIIALTVMPAPVPVPVLPPAPAPAPTPTPAPRPGPDCNDACMRSLREEIQGLRARQDTLEARQEALRARNAALQKEVRALKNRVIAENMDLTYALSTGVLMTANLTPNVGPGVWLGGELRTGPFALAVEARAALPSSVQVGPYTTDLSEYTLNLVPCGRYRYVVDFFGCGVAGGGFHYDYDSDYIDGPSSLLRPIVRLGGRMGLEVPFMDNRLAVRGWADVLYMLPPATNRYFKNGELEASRDIPSVSAFFGVGFVIKFGNQETR